MIHLHLFICWFGLPFAHFFGKFASFLLYHILFRKTVAIRDVNRLLFRYFDYGIID